jgi:hypothetical protein
MPPNETEEDDEAELDDVPVATALPVTLTNTLPRTTVDAVRLVVLLMATLVVLESDWVTEKVPDVTGPLSILTLELDRMVTGPVTGGTAGRNKPFPLMPIPFSSRL